MNKPIRVLHVLAAMERAGTENLIMNLYRNIDRTKLQFDFAVSAKHKCAFDDEIKSLGGKIYHYPRYRGTNHFKYVAWWKVFFKQHPEHSIVHGHIGSTAAIYLRIAKKNNRYTIAHSHATNSNLSLSSIIYRIYSYRTRFIADYFFACSNQALVDRYGKRIAKNKAKSSVLNNAIDTQLYKYDKDIRNQTRKEFNLDDNGSILGTVGRLTKAKNPDMIIEIIKRLSCQKKEFRFMWVGTGELEQEIKYKVKLLNLDNRVIFTGVRNDVNKLLMAMDLFVFPSLWEGLGISCVEAQASGLPTLCSDTVPLDANVSDLFLQLPLQDSGKWCDEINRQLSSCLRHDRSSAYKQVFDHGYDIHDVASRLEKFYMNIEYRR